MRALWPQAPTASSRHTSCASRRRQRRNIPTSRRINGAFLNCAKTESGRTPHTAAGFGARRTLEDFDWDAQPAIRPQVAALASGAFLAEVRNIVLLGPPGTGKTHLAIALGIVAARHGHRVLFATATDWVTRLTDAHRQATTLRAHHRRSRLPPTPQAGSQTNSVGQEAANLVFQLVSSRYEHASLMLTSNLPFSSWGGVFGDQAVAAAMIDRIVHHAGILTLKGVSYRLRGNQIDSLLSTRTTNNPDD